YHPAAKPPEVHLRSAEIAKQSETCELRKGGGYTGGPEAEPLIQLVVGVPRQFYESAPPFLIQGGDSRLFNYVKFDQEGRYLSLVGKRPGHTTLILWLGNPFQICGLHATRYSIEVLPETVLHEGSSPTSRWPTNSCDLFRGF